MTRVLTLALLIACAACSRGSTPRAPSPAGSPTAPSGLSAAYDPPAVAVQLAWTDASRDEERFVVERRMADADWVGLTELPAGATEYRDRALRPGTAFRYRVRAANARGESPPSNEVEIATPPVVPRVCRLVLQTGLGRRTPPAAPGLGSDALWMTSIGAGERERLVASARFSPLGDSVELLGDDAAGGVAVDLRRDAVADIVVFELALRLLYAPIGADRGGELCLGLHDARRGPYGILLAAGSGGPGEPVRADLPAPLSIEIGREYRVEIAIDTRAARYDVRVAGELLARGVPLTSDLVVPARFAPE